MGAPVTSVTWGINRKGMKQNIRNYNDNIIVKQTISLHGTKGGEMTNQNLRKTY